MPDPHNELQARMAEINESLQGQVTDLNAANAQIQAQLAGYVKFGEVASIEEAFTRIPELETKLQASTDALTDIQESLKQLVGGEGDVITLIGEALESGKAATDTLTSINEEYGSVENIGEAMAAAEGTLTEVHSILESLGCTLPELKKFQAEYGSIKEISESINVSTGILVKIQEEKAQEEIEATATKYGKTPEEVSTMMEKYKLESCSQVEEMFKDTGVMPVEEVEESFNGKQRKPGRAFTALTTGASFSRSLQDISEDHKGGKFQRENAMANENSPQRMEKLL